MINRLEIYAIILAVWGLTIVAAEFHGRYAEKAAITTKQLADNAADMAKYQTTLASRADADETARKKTQDFIDAIDKGLTNVHTKFAQLPSVVLDPRGCERLTANARLRWNAVELLPAGPTDQPAGSPSGAVQTAPVPPP